MLLRSADSDTQVVLAHFGFATKCDGKSLKQVCINVLSSLENIVYIPSFVVATFKICGTPDYVAPEILMHALYDFKVTNDGAP